MQRFAKSVEATANNGYTITLPDKSTAIVTVDNGAIIKVNDGTKDITATSGYYLIKGYRVTLNYKDNTLTSTAVKEESSENISTSQVYTVKLNAGDTTSQDVTVTGNVLGKDQSTTTVGTTTVNLTIDETTKELKGTYDSTSETTPSNIIRSYTLKVGETTLATVTVDKDSKIKVNDTEYSGNFRINGYELTLAAKDGALTSASAAELQSTTPTGGETVYSVKVDNTDNVESVKIADGKFVVTNDSTTYTTAQTITYTTTYTAKVNGKDVTLTIDENGTLKGTYDNTTYTTATAFKSYTLKLADGTTLATVTVDKNNLIKVNDGDSTRVTAKDVDGWKHDYKPTLTAEDGELKTASAVRIEEPPSYQNKSEGVKIEYTVAVGDESETIIVTKDALDIAGGTLSSSTVTVGDTVVSLKARDNTIEGTYDKVVEDSQVTFVNVVRHYEYSNIMGTTKSFTVDSNNKIIINDAESTGTITFNDWGRDYTVEAENGKFKSVYYVDRTSLSNFNNVSTYAVNVDGTDYEISAEQLSQLQSGDLSTITFGGAEDNTEGAVEVTFTKNGDELTGNYYGESESLTLTTVTLADALKPGATIDIKADYDIGGKATSFTCTYNADGTFTKTSFSGVYGKY